MTTTETGMRTTYDFILLERSDSFAVITINRPKVLNALNSGTLAEIRAAIDDFGSDPAIRAIIVTGSGEKAFAAGADITELQSLESARDGFEHSRSAHSLLFAMHELDKPVIMAVNGYALGGGCELALGGDIIIASDNARFGQPEVNLGIIPGFGGSQRLPRLVGRTRALEMILLGEQITAQEALQIGLVNRVVPQADLRRTAEEIALKIAEKGPVAIALAKRAVYEGLETGPRAGNEAEMTYFGLAIGTQDRKEGTGAFLEKRRPTWQGK
ncbi:MAG: enoyl-CoA hydratase-related protein [Chloroflexota bacterium]